jgi:hypothetical protein
MNTAEAQLAALRAGQETKLCRISPHGSLYARKDAVGAVTFTWRWTHQGVNDRQKIGLWDSAADPRKIEQTARGWTVKAAIRMAEEWALEHDRTIPLGGYRASYEEIKKADEAAAVVLSHHSLGQLMEDYAKMLEMRVTDGSKKSAGDVRSATNTHIKLKHIGIYHMPAMQVGREDIIKILQTINDKGYRPISGKVRSYLHTAYETALAVTTQSDIPEEFRAYQISSNPVSSVGKPSAPKVGKIRDIKALSVDQMRIYWSIIKDMPGFQGAVLRLHLLLGGPRIVQLARLLTANIDSQSIILYDGKGKGSEIRVHMLPLTDLARKALAACAPRGKYALSTGDGTKHVRAETVSAWAQNAVGRTFPDFELKLIRSGVKGLLSSWNISEEYLNRLQSHGLSSVQARFYNAHKYQKALLGIQEVLEAVITGRWQEPPELEMVAILRAQQAALACANAQPCVP